MNSKKKVFLLAIIALGLSGLLRTAASANTLVLTYGAHHFGNGGEFNAYSTTLSSITSGYATPAKADVGSGGVGFETFCLELNEEFVPGGTYNYAISQAAYHGGVAGGSDPLSLGAAWLYLNFAHGTLTGYNYTNTDAGALQNAVWWLENELATQDLSNPFENLVVAHFGGVAQAMADNNGFFRVGVLNLTYLNGDLSQDQLVLLPDGGTTGVLLGLGMVALFLASRKARRGRAGLA